LNARDADFALETGACRIINIKVGRVGGFSEAKKDSRCRGAAQCSGVVRRNAGIGGGAGAQHRVVDARKFPLAGRCVGLEALLERGHHRARSGSARRWNDCDQRRAGNGLQVREDLVRKFTVREETFRAGKA
jgi:o-succinylbenzoate synthase